LFENDLICTWYPFSPQAIHSIVDDVIPCIARQPALREVVMVAKDWDDCGVRKGPFDGRGDVW